MKILIESIVQVIKMLWVFLGIATIFALLLCGAYAIFLMIIMFVLRIAMPYISGLIN